MTRKATPKAIAEYRDKLLTNPASLLQNMRRVREVLRERSEQVFIERDLTVSDKAIDDDTRKEEFERLDEQILRVGARIDDLDKQIEAHIKKHPDVEIAAKLMEAPPPGAAMSRQHRRQMERQLAKAASKSKAKRAAVLVEQDPTDPDPARKSAPISKSQKKRLTAQGAPLPAGSMGEPTAEETPEAE